MAGDWLKWTKGLARCREVVILASIVKRDRHEVAGRLMTLWEWCDDNATEQDADDELNVSLEIGDKPLEFFDTILGVEGMAAAMASAGVGWLRVLGDGRVIFPHLARHNGSPAKSRAKETSKKKDQRARANLSPLLSPGSGDGNGDSNGTREEKRREEGKDKEPPAGHVSPERRGKPAVYDPKAEALPFGGSPAFRAKWASWCDYLDQIGRALVKPTAEMQLSDLGRMTEAEAVAMIEASIRNGWKGLFPAKGEKNDKPPPKPSPKEAPPPYDGPKAPPMWELDRLKKKAQETTQP